MATMVAETTATPEIIFRQTPDQEIRKAEAPGYTTIDHDGFMAMLESYNTPEEMHCIEAAYILAKGAHRNQKRYSGRRYFDHPREVAIILFKELQLPQWWLTVIALLHDTLEAEKPSVNPWLLNRVFGRRVTISLKSLSKIPKEGYYDRLREFGTAMDLIAKLTDTLHNARTLYACPLEIKEKQVREITAISLPLADLLISKFPSQKWRGEYLKTEIQAAIRPYLHLLG